MIIVLEYRMQVWDVPMLLSVYYLSTGVMVHPLGDYACQPSDSSVIAHSLTAFYYINGAAYTNGQTQTIANSCAKVHKLNFLTRTTMCPCYLWC